jgi:hypothetical protein
MVMARTPEADVRLHSLRMTPRHVGCEPPSAGVRHPGMLKRTRWLTFLASMVRRPGTVGMACGRTMLCRPASPFGVLGRGARSSLATKGCRRKEGALSASCHAQVGLTRGLLR